MDPQATEAVAARADFLVNDADELLPDLGTNRSRRPLQEKAWRRGDFRPGARTGQAWQERRLYVDPPAGGGRRGGWGHAQRDLREAPAHSQPAIRPPDGTGGGETDQEKRTSTRWSFRLGAKRRQ